MGGGAPVSGGGMGGGGGSKSVDQIKKVIMDSNPVLEAFGNAKTVRNDNSSRFGKYLEIQFQGNAPVGGCITSFLLESTRVAFQGKGERNFHIFYDLFKGVTSSEREELGLGNDPQAFSYLAKSGCTTVDGVDDAAEFAEVKNSMGTIGIPPEAQSELWRILAAILWLGNIEFIDESPARVKDQSALEWVAHLLQVSTQVLEICLTHKFLQSGSARATTYQSPQNASQSEGIRDALAKTLYARMFDYLVTAINQAMAYGMETNVVGILDIYGFEIFDHNSFEQFCINYVNERLQQIFIDLTIKAEQDEYEAEGIKWKSISYFNNKIVCDLIEASRPPGLFRTLDDVCRTVHAGDQATMDKNFMERVVQMEHPHLKVPKEEGYDFTVKHYAGDVTYDAQGFAFKNKDTLFVGLITSMQESSSQFIKNLFPENMSNNKSAPPTSGTKIRQSSSYLVERLNKTIPHYVRCIKSNDSKTPMGFNDKRVEHQVKYLGLLENVRVRKAGHSYRTAQEYFTKRYGILCTKTDEEQVPYEINVVIDWIRANVKEINVNEEIHLGKSKIFVRSPESIFILEDLRLRRMDPEGYKEQLREYKEKEKIARQQLSKGSPGKKCAIM